MVVKIEWKTSVSGLQGDTNLLDEYVNNVKINRETVLVASKGASVEVKAGGENIHQKITLLENLVHSERKILIIHFLQSSFLDDSTGKY